MNHVKLYKHVIRFVPKILDQTTMYRVVIIALLAISFVAGALSVAGILFAKPLELGASFLVIGLGTVLAHHTMAYLSKAPANAESSLITGLILFLILPPTTDVRILAALFATAALAIVLKYIVVFRKRHIFNPVALALVLVGAFGIVGADWWVGSRYLLPIVAVAGLVIVMKTRRWTLVGTYFLVSIVTVLGYQFHIRGVYADTSLTQLADPSYVRSLLDLSTDILMRHFLSWPTVFFATVMLTEPLGLPATRGRQNIFATIAGVLSSISFSIGTIFGTIYSTPELALIVANFYTFVREFPGRLLLVLKNKKQVGQDTYEYTFEPSYPIKHEAGQYLEWTLPHESPDKRGIRRYLSISSAPSDPDVSFAIRHVEDGSSWKQFLFNYTIGDKLYATQLAGDFMLVNQASHHVFIAGGIGITPFMSMIREAVLQESKLSATLLYCNRNAQDIAFEDELSQAEQKIKLSVIPVLENSSYAHPQALVGYLSEESVKNVVPEWESAYYYLSGPPPMVNAYKTMLLSMGISRSQIRTDYFPGLA